MAEIVDELRMEVRGLMLDPTSNAPIVLLQDEAREILLPIWIGLFEASAISLSLEGQEPVRPMTHDLLLSAISTLGSEVEKVLINDLKDGTFFAEIHLQRAGEPLRLDARPSDAIALALRARRPVYVRHEVLAKAQVLTTAASEEESQERLRRMLEELDPEDLGKYTM